MLVALTLFTIGTAGCALSQTMLQLVIARGIAGCGGGGLMGTPNVFSRILKGMV